MTYIPALQDARRDTYIPVGVRDCFWARPGNVFYSVDFTGGELVTFAEACVARVGYSKLGEALNAGADAHAMMGAEMLGVDDATFAARLAAKDPQAKGFRQCGKWGNFGFMGGMGAVKFVLTQRRQGDDTEWPDGPSILGNGKRGYKGLRLCLLMGRAQQCGTDKTTIWPRGGERWAQPCPPTCVTCIECAMDIKSAWFRKWPEARAYLDWHGDNESRTVVQHYSGRIRGGLTYCSEANGDFQALLADIAKRSLIRVTFEQYVGKLTAPTPRENARLYAVSDAPSPLAGSRGELFAHDELLGECRESVGHEVATRVEAVMVEEFRKGCPHHRAACKAEPALMRRWFKAAGPVYVDGRLVPWEPRA